MRRYIYATLLAVAVLVCVFSVLSYTTRSKVSGGTPRSVTTDLQVNTGDNGPPSMIRSGTPSP